MTRKKIVKIIAALVLLFAFSLKGMFIKNPVLNGETMGTRYCITLSSPIYRKTLTKLHTQIKAELKEVNRQMSTWDEASEISRFNRFNSTDPFQTSAGFLTVVQRALELSRDTQGAFDPTLQPLLNLWGFGSGGTERKVPPDSEIITAKSETGWQKITTTPDFRIQKSAPKIQLALGAIAKGYGADRIGLLLDQKGYKNWFVEIGGEVVVRGFNPDKVPWRIGVQSPTLNQKNQPLQGIVHLSEGAVATSGDYRNYIREDDHVYSHILDPRSGRAIRSDTASVTVIAPTCMDADGIATALFVMGVTDGLKWVEAHPQVEALFLIRGANQKIIEKISSGFKASTSYTPLFNLNEKN